MGEKEEKLPTFEQIHKAKEGGIILKKDKDGKIVDKLNVLKLLDKKIVDMKSVVWKTGVSDEELVSYMRSVDLCIVPYFETGQSGSGIVSLAIQNSNKTILSDTGVAFMIQPYLDQSLILFDVASLTNLKTSIQSALANEDYNPRFKSSFSEMINLYVSTLR